MLTKVLTVAGYFRGQQTMICGPLIFVNKVLLRHAHAHSVKWYPLTAFTEFNSYNSHHVTGKAENIFWSFAEICWPLVYLMEFGAIYFPLQLFMFYAFVHRNKPLFHYLFCLVWFFLDENQLAVLTQEHNLFYGSLGILSNSLIKVGKNQRMVITHLVRNR